MFLHLSIHQPHPEAADALIDSMHRFGAALRTQRGLINTAVFKSTDGKLIGLALWESEDAWRAGRQAGRDAVADDPFDKWESAEVVGFAGAEARGR